MHLGNFMMLCLVALSVVGWTLCHSSNEFVSVFMEERASFFNILPLRSACYHSEIENISKLRCISQCLAQFDVCKGILFNKDRQTCKLIDCNPADTFDGPDIDTGRWDLYGMMVQNGINVYISKYYLIVSLLCLSLLFFSLNESSYQGFFLNITNCLVSVFKFVEM